MEETEVYFAFGSNLSARKMREGGTRFISRESAVLRGLLVVFCIWKDDGFRYANSIPDNESTVYGALYICLKGSKLASKISQTINTFFDYLDPPLYRTFFFDPIFPEDINLEISPWYDV